MRQNRRIFLVMTTVGQALALFFWRPFQVATPARSQNLLLRHQLNIALRRAQPRLRRAAKTGIDDAFALHRQVG